MEVLTAHEITKDTTPNVKLTEVVRIPTRIAETTNFKRQNHLKHQE